MYSRRGWYIRVVAIWAFVIALGCSVTYLLVKLPLHLYLRGVLGMALWSCLGFSLAGPWSYGSYVRHLTCAERKDSSDVSECAHPKDVTNLRIDGLGSSEARSLRHAR